MFNYQNPNYYQQPSQPAFVHGEAGAKNFPVGPGQKVILLDDSADVLYIKEGTPNGMFTLDIYDLVKREPDPGTQYVTRQELDNITANLKRFFDQKLEELTK